MGNEEYPSVNQQRSERGEDMKRSQLWRASITMIVISAYSIFGLALGQESGSPEGGGEHGDEGCSPSGDKRVFPSPGY